MNKIFKIKYDPMLGRTVIMSELGKTTGKKSSRILITAAVVGGLFSNVVIAGENQIGNDRPSSFFSRINDTEIDAKLATFRQDPSLNSSKYHVNVGDYNMAVVGQSLVRIANSDQVGGAAFISTISDACKTDAVTKTTWDKSCSLDDKKKITEYLQDYTLEAIKLRDNEVPNPITSVNGINYTPGGDYNKDVYTISGGDWDEMDWAGGDNRPMILPSTATLGAANSGKGKNSGVYRDIYADHATLNVEGNATFISRPTSHRAIVYAVDGAKINFKGEHTYIINMQPTSSNGLDIGSRKELSADDYFSNVTAENLTIFMGNGKTKSQNRGARAIILGSEDVNAQTSTLTVNKNLNVDLRSWTNGANVVDIKKSGEALVKGITKIASDRVDSASLGVSGQFHGVGDINIISGNNMHWAGGYRNQKGITNSGVIHADANVTVRALSHGSTGISLNTSSKGERSVTDIAGNLTVNQGAARSYDLEAIGGGNGWATREVIDGTGVHVNGGDLRVAGNYSGLSENTHDTTALKVIDGAVSVAGKVNLETKGANKGSTKVVNQDQTHNSNNVLIDVNGANANLNVVGETNLTLNSRAATAVKVTKGQAILGEGSVPDSATFRAGSGVTNHENATLVFNKGKIIANMTDDTGVLLEPEAGKKAIYTQKEDTSITMTGTGANGIVVKDASADTSFDMTVNGKVELTKDDTESLDANQLPSHAAINLAGEGTLSVGNTAEILNKADKTAILKKDDRNITADIAGKVVGKVLFTGAGVNKLTLSDKADSKTSNMTVIDGGSGAGESSIVLKGEGYLLNAYTDANKATLPTNETASQLLNWDNLTLQDSASEDVGKFVTLNLVGDTKVKTKTTIGTNSFLTKKQIKEATLTTGTLVNNGTIDLRNNDQSIDNKLTIAGNYVGNNGKLVLNAHWDEGGDKKGTNSKSDVLHITGSASGTTSVITMSGTEKEVISGTAKEVKGQRFNTVPVVVVDGQDSGTSFTGRARVGDGTNIALTNREKGIGREYYWTLYAEDTPTVNPPITPPVNPPVTPPVNPPVNPPVTPPNTPILDPLVPIATLIPKANLELGYTTLSGLHDRRGELQSMVWDSCGCVQKHAKGQAWVRVFGQRLELDGEYRFGLKARNYGIQVGYDFDINYDAEDGSRQHSGVYLGYGRGNTDFFDRYRAENDPINGKVRISDDKLAAKGNTDAYTLGLSHIRFAKHGGYMDFVAQFSLLNNSYKLRDFDVTAKQKGLSAAVSVEAGRPFMINQSNWMIEPQAQLTYQFLHLNKFSDGTYQVAQGDSHGLRGRVGFRLAHNSQNGHFTNTIYLTANILHDFTTQKSAKVGTDEYSEKFNRTWWDLGVGAQTPVSKHGYVYSSIHYEHSFSGEKRKGYRASIGYKYTW